MTAARGDQPPPDGIDCDEVRTIATLRRERNDQCDAIHEALAMVSAMRHERDEARAQLAALRPKWSNEPPRREGWYWDYIPEVGVGVIEMSECPANYVGYPGQKWAGPLPEPEETP